MTSNDGDEGRPSFVMIFNHGNEGPVVFNDGDEGRLSFLMIATNDGDEGRLSF